MDITGTGTTAVSMSNQLAMAKLSVAILKQAQKAEQQVANSIVQMINQTTAMSRPGLRTDGLGEVLDIKV